MPSLSRRKQLSTRPHLRLIAVLGLIVPRRLRADWRQEWEAELRYREMLLAEWDRLDWRNKLDLLRRSTAAFWDALLLQPQRLEDQMFQDLRYGVRMLLKHKGFTLVAVLSLALGIGANTALFSVVDAVLLQTLPVKEPDRLVLFEWEAGQPFRTSGSRGSFLPRSPGRRGGSVFRYDIFERLRQARAQAESDPLSDLFAFAPLYGVTAVANEQAEVVRGQAVSGRYYAGLGVQPILGRALTDSDDQPGAPPAVVVSHQYWQERLGANPDIIGQQLKLNNISFTIVGVTPPGFTGTLQVDQRPAVTVALVAEPLLMAEATGMSRQGKPGIWWLNMMGRLKPGATLEQASQSLEGVFEATALEVMPPPRRENDPAQLDPKDYPQLLALSGSRGLMETRKTYSATIYGMFGIVAMVLLIACANVANLLLSRAALRGPEIGVRLAVGAGRWRLIRQLLTESILLSSLGGALGVLFALWGKGVLVAMSDRDTGFLPADVDPSTNWRVLAFTAAVSLLTGVLFGVVPAWRATRLDLTTALKQGGRTTGVVSRLSKGLIVAQVALSLLLLIGAGLFIRTLNNLQRVDLGFNQESLLVFSLQPKQGGYKDERLIQFYQELFARLDNLPGVRAASFSRIPLITHSLWNSDFLLPGETEKSIGSHVTNRQMVRENYFATMEIPMLRGRGFTEQDDQRGAKVAIVNQEFGRKFFPDEDVVGKRIVDTDTKREVEIVGVVADTKYNSQRTEIEPLFYTSWRQESEAIGEMHFALRTLGEPTALSSSVREVVRQMDSNLPVSEVSTQEERSHGALGQERLYARLLSFFGAVALLLAAIGLYGVLAYSVAQRTNEIGIRMALGAQPANILRLVIWQGMRLVLLGLIVGVGCGYGLKRLLESQYFGPRTWQREMADKLYGVQWADPLTLAVIATLLMLAALAACWLPARKAARVDPLAALRHE